MSLIAKISSQDAPIEQLLMLIGKFSMRTSMRSLLKLGEYSHVQ